MNARNSIWVLVCAMLFWQGLVWGESDECEGDDCDQEAPYVLRIIKSGESKPRSPNVTSDGLQDNRRVDVTVTRKVPVDSIKRETRRALFGTGGAIWLSKDPTSLERILSVKAPVSVSLNNETESSAGLVSPISFDVRTNYPHFIDRLELLVWSQNATQLSEPLIVKVLDSDKLQQTFEWDGVLDNIALEDGLSLQYSVRAYDEAGRYDESTLSVLSFNDSDQTSTELITPDLTIAEDGETDDDQYVELARQSIPIQGSKVRILGQDLRPSSEVSINGESVAVMKDGRFGLEYLLPAGEYQFDVIVLDDEENEIRKELNIKLDADYFFMVGLADLTVGQNTVSGSIEPLAVDSQHYGGDIFVDGRLAFYLKGKVRGKYLITAQMDTGTENIEDLFDDFHRKDPNSVFRRLDPDQYYPVYGDDSTVIDDTDSQGKLYVRMDWDRSRLLWGNFNTNINDTEYVPYNRSLYGAQLDHKSVNDTALGDASHSLKVFASKAQSLYRHNEFLGTGGSLYYLRDTDIVIGSEKVWVEVRQAGTSRVVQKVPLVSGRDYDIDDFQGRLILRRPLLSVANSGAPSIIRDEPLAGNQTYLVVEYEYSPVNFDFSGSNVGARGKKWLTDNIGIGGTWIYEQRDGNDYEIKGTDLTLKRSNETFIKGEFAQSESTLAAGSFLSSDGGITFDNVQANGTEASGRAFGIEARASLTDFRPKSKPFEVGAWAKRRQAGFSATDSVSGVHTTDIGIEAVSRPSDKIALYARASRLEKKDESIESSVSGQIDYKVSDRISASTELRNKRDQNLVSDTQGESTILAGKVSVDVNSRLNVYGVQQMSLKESGTVTRNNSSALGAKYNVNEKVSLSGEMSTGDKGKSALLGTEVNVSETYKVYTNYIYSFDSDQVQKNTLVLGQRKTVSSQLQVYSEHQFTDEDNRDGYAHTIGLDQKLNQYTSASLSAQRAKVENEDGSSTERDSVSVGLGYQRDNVQINSKFEYRWDNGIDLETEQWVVTNRFQYRKSPSFRWQGKLNASVTEDKLADDDARFIEAGLGFAYRPVTNDRLNMLGRLTYLNDLPPLSQSAQTDQRSLIASVEGLYELTHTWSIGGKLAHRTSEIRIERNAGEWIDNDASLASARLRYKARFGIDASAAYHWLDSNATQGTRHGALFTIGRRIGDHLTFSVGYNFTSFDDNLENDSYDLKGWFINLVGTY